MDSRTDELLTIKQVAAILGISERTLLNLRHRAQRPAPIRIGQRHIKFRRSEVEAYIVDCEKITVNECIVAAEERAARRLPGSPAREGQEGWSVQSPAGSNQRLVSHAGRTRA
jgi:excisionase family DNA binding protein